MLYLTNADVQRVLDMGETLDALRQGYADLARGDAVYIPRIDLYAPTGRDDDYYRWGSMTGYCRSEDVVACRIKSDVVFWPDGRTEEKYCMQPGTYSGIILVYRASNGEPLAIVQDGYLQHMRVGGSAGLGVDVLARKDAATVGVLGSGGMARTYLQAIAAARPLRSGKVYSPTPEHRERFAAQMSDELHMQLWPVGSAEEAVRGADIVVTATDSIVPTFDAAWVSDGAHMTCVTRREMDQTMLDRADVIVQLGWQTIKPGADVPDLEWPRSAMAAYIAGQPHERARIPRGRAEEQGNYPLLVDVVAGRQPGRTDDRQVTMFVNTGTQGLQFAAVAGRAYRLARQADIGQELPTAWFLQDIRD
ncbi:MAG TPA: ornithine cyclodeaminase family protein [Chloroflexota bacterium]|nr:ornithine cyclodeaminase family protein [Chloroflexota bacterium]